MRPLQKLTRKKVVWQWVKQQQEAFGACKNALIEYAQLYIPRRGHPFELEVTILDDRVSWGLWQMTGLKNQKEPVGFWSKALQGSTIHYTLMKKQILAVLWALQVPERITGQDSVTIHTPMCVHGWVTDDSIRAGSSGSHPLEMETLFTATISRRKTTCNHSTHHSSRNCII